MTAGASAGRRLGEHQPHLVPLADRVVAETTPRRWPATTWSSSRCRTAPRPRSPPQLDPETRGHRLRRRLPARRSRGVAAVLRLRRTPAPGRTACPSCPGQREKLAGARRIAVPGCYPTTATLALLPAITARSDRRPGRGDRRGQRPLRGRPVAQAAPARVGADGLGQRVRRRRRAPAHPGAAAELHAPAAPRRPAVSFTPVLVPMSRGILATCTAPLADRAHAPSRRTRRTPRPTPTSRSSTCCRRDSGRRPSRCWAPTPSTSRSPSTPRPAGWSPWRPWTT